MPDLRQLRYFIALAETLHFGRAAERLYITQPSLSRQLAELEAELGTPLLLRTSRSVALTPAGRSFYQHAREVLAALDLAVRSSRAVGRGEAGELRLAFTMCAAWNLLPRLLRHYHQQCPAVEVHLQEIVPRDLEQALASGSVDLGVSFPAASGSRLHYRRLLDEGLCVVLPAEHPLAQREEVAVAALAGENFISFPASTAPALHAAVSGHCRAHGFEPRARLRAAGAVGDPSAADHRQPGGRGAWRGAGAGLDAAHAAARRGIPPAAGPAAGGAGAVLERA